MNLQQKYDDIISKQSTDIGCMHLEEMKIDTDPNISPVASKLFPLPLTHHKFVKDEIGNLSEAGLIEKSMSCYAIPLIVAPKKVNQQHP